MGDEQVPQRVAATRISTQETNTSSDAWGQPISTERQAELQGYLDRWEQEHDHGERRGPFDGEKSGLGVPLSGADVY